MNEKFKCSFKAETENGYEIRFEHVTAAPAVNSNPSPNAHVGFYAQPKTMADKFTVGKVYELKETTA